MDQEAVKEQVEKDGQDGFAAFLRERVLARRLSVRGRSIIDDQGSMLLADEVEQDETTSADAANEVMQRWEVVL